MDECIQSIFIMLQQPTVVLVCTVQFIDNTDSSNFIGKSLTSLITEIISIIPLPFLVFQFEIARMYNLKTN